MATDETHHGDESPPEYDADRFVRASDLRRKERYCPHCRELHSGFVFSRFVGESDRPRAEYRCYECGCIRHFGVLVQ